MNSLQAKVIAVNRCHLEATRLFPIMATIFAPLLGKQLDKASGGFLEKVKKLLPELANSHKLQIHRISTDYSLAFAVKTCELYPHDNKSFGDNSLYHEVGVYIGDMKNGVLTSLAKEPQLRCDYSVEEVNNKREAVKSAKKVLSDAESALQDFELYDR